MASQFADDMSKAESFVELITSTFDLAKSDTKRLRSKHPLVVGALDVHTKARKLGGTSEAFDGTFLTICAQYELAVCNLIGVFVGHLCTKIPIYHNLPTTIRMYYPKGCAIILTNIKEEKYQHLTQDAIVKSLASCVICSAKKPYNLVEDAFSHHEHNLNANVIKEIFEDRLGVENIWNRLAHQPALADYLHSNNEDAIASRARETLNTAIRNRNNITHRGKSFYHVGESELRDTVHFFSVLINSLATVMDIYLQSL